MLFYTNLKKKTGSDLAEDRRMDGGKPGVLETQLFHFDKLLGYVFFFFFKADS